MPGERNHQRKRIVYFFLLALFFSRYPVFAQTPSALPTQTIQTIRSVRVSGNTLLTNDQIATATRPFIGKELNLVIITNLVSTVTEAYREKGFFLARAYMPEQEIQNGDVVVAVLEGKIGTFSVTGNEYYLTSFIKKHFVKINEPEGSRIDLIKRSILVLNDYPDLKAEVLFKPGGARGTTDMEVMIKDYQPIHLLLDYNNFGSKAVSRNRFGIGVDAGNLVNEGHLLSFRGMTGAPTRNMTYVRGGYIAPLDYNGRKLHVTYANGDFDVGREFERLNINLKTEALGISVSYPYLLTRFERLSGEAGLKINDFTQTALGTLSSKDRIRVLSGKLDYNSQTESTRDFLTVELSQGLGELFGGMGRRSSRVSRPGADGLFTKGTIDWVRVRRIPQPYWLKNPFSLVVAGGAQISSDNLVVGEQFSLGGADSVRGYPVGEFLGDHGNRLSSELRVSPFPKAEQIQGALFLDHGGGFVKRQSGVEKREEYLTGMGLGVRFDFPRSITLRKPVPDKPGYVLDSRFQMRLDIGFPVDPSPSSTGKIPTYYLQAMGRF